MSLNAKTKQKLNPWKDVDAVAFRRLADGEYEVTLRGEVLGRVWKGWVRNGGTGWLTQCGKLIQPTRHKAVHAALQRLTQGGTFNAAAATDAVSYCAHNIDEREVCDACNA